MYVNQIDDIIDKLLDKLYLDGIFKDETFKSIIDNKKTNFVEYRDKINNFIENSLKLVDKNAIQELINNRENIIRIMDIIKRYISYYYFLSLAYYYTGTLKDFRNNLIQYSKLQENSTFVIKNFFDTENNYQIIKFYKMIKDITKILLMTDLQKKVLNQHEIKDAIDFLNSIGKNYIDNYILKISTDSNNDTSVDINVHNLIKTIVFKEIYRNQEQHLIFEILNDIEETKHEYTFIDIVVADEDVIDYDSFRQLFIGEKRANIMAISLYDLINETSKIQSLITSDKKNTELLKIFGVTPIVDDFCRYHRDTEKIETELQKPILLSTPQTTKNNIKNIHAAILQQQRKKKDNTKAQIIVDKIDIISDFYSDNVKNNKSLSDEINKYFQNPFIHRKAVMHNYVDETKVLQKIKNLGRKAIQDNEYYLELKHIISNAYFNFKDFKKYGSSIILNTDYPIELIRFNNIEYQKQIPHLDVETRFGTDEMLINLVGLTIGPLNNLPIRCIKKDNLLDIRNFKFNYMKNGKIKTYETDNGFLYFYKLIKYIYIKTLSVKLEPYFHLYHNYTEIIKNNPGISDKIIYWVYDIEKDVFDMETYENIKINNFQEKIKYMNSTIYDKIVKLLNTRLVTLIDENRHLPISKINLLIELYTRLNRIFLGEDDKREFFISNILRKKIIDKSNIKKIKDTDFLEMPEFISIPDKSVLKIKINTINPINLTEYFDIVKYKENSFDLEIQVINKKCKHEDEWNNTMELKNDNINKYNVALTDFMNKYVQETPELDYVCRICGQILPMKRFVQDGSFDDESQKFVAAYTPLDISLDEIKEYSRYKLTIKYLELVLVNRVSLITGTNMLIGNDKQIKNKKIALVKNIIDIILKHNATNLKSNQSEEDRLNFFSKKFNIDKEIDSVYFFELDDSFLNISPTSQSIDKNKLISNNILLYFMLIFMTELNGAQISMMQHDKIANIYTYLKFGPKMFGNLLIKTNINDMETVSILKYPVLCYLIFLISYFLIKYKLWYYPGTDTKTYNPVYAKVITHSLIDLFNGISINAGKYPDDYVYKLISSKLYSQLNNVFKNNDIIEVLKKNHIKYVSSSDKPDEIKKSNDIITYYINNPIKTKITPRTLPSFKISNGIQYDLRNNIMYEKTSICTDITNCKFGSIHTWITKNKIVECSICKETVENNDGKIDRQTETYYYNMNKIANRRCISGKIHDFVGKDGKFLCSICNKPQNTSYTNEELDKLALNMSNLEDEQIEKILNDIKETKEKIAKKDNNNEKNLEDIVIKYIKEFGTESYGKNTLIVDKFIDKIENIIGTDAKFEIDKIPVYLKNNVYIIDHSADGNLLNEPIILTDKDNRISFKENHPYFKTDVYFYTDNRTQNDVFYHAISLKILGHKQKHQDYVENNKPNVYLKIIPSIRNRIISIGYETKYIDITKSFEENKLFTKDSDENLFLIIENLIKDHIIKIKSLIDKFYMILFKIKNFIPVQEEQGSDKFISSTTKYIDNLISKYTKIVSTLNNNDIDIITSDWNILRNMLFYKEVKWIDTDIRFQNIMYVNSDLINYYDSTSNLMMYYFLHSVDKIILSNTEKITKITLVQLFVDIIIYIYDIYNIDRFKNIIDYKRFTYILDGSEFLIDTLKKGQGMVQITENEIEEKINGEQEDEAEDLREELEALDVDNNYYAEEDADAGDRDNFED